MNIDAITIRRIDEFELEQMAIIWNQHIDKITSSKRNVTAEGLAQYREGNSGKEYYGYFDIRRSNQYLLGFASIDIEEGGMYLNQIAVFEDVLNTGVGSQIIQYLQELANAKQIPISLAVQVINIPGIKFFLSHGFEIVEYIVEENYVPMDFDVNNFEDRIRLIEYNMRWFFNSE